MKWPNELVFIRHGQSVFNEFKESSKIDPEYKKFRELFDKAWEGPLIYDWASPELAEMAQKLWKKREILPGDYETPLTELGVSQAEATGKRLHELISLPDVIYVSPYIRTRQTLESLIRGYPELGTVKTLSEERVREQEHGLLSIYNDWRFYYSLNPLQGFLRRKEGDYSYRFLNGESKSDVRDRVRSFMSTVIRENAGQKVLVISHHLTLISMRANLERWMPEKFIEVDAVDKPINCGVTVYRGEPNEGKDGKLKLFAYNQRLY